MPYAALYNDCQVLDKPTQADLERLATEADPTGLMIIGYPFASMHALSHFGRVEVLKIQGAPKLAQLDGLEDLPALREFVLATPTGSNGSGRCIEIESFRPLERLGGLSRLILQSVRSRDLDLAPLMRMQHLQDLDVGGVPEFTVEHYARLRVALPTTSGRCLEPYVEIQGIGKCRKCPDRQVLLNGAPPRARKWVCPTCNPKLLAAHLQKWEAVTGKPYQAGP